MLSDGFKFKKDYSDFFTLNWLKRYEALRVITKIEFLDYNMLEVKQSFHVKDNYIDKSIIKEDEKKLIDTSFFALPETYNVNEILMHNTRAYINDKEVAITESDKLNLANLNNCYIIYSTKEILEYLEILIKNELLDPFPQQFKEELEFDLEKYRNTFKIFFHTDITFKEYLEDYNLSSISKEERFSNLDLANEKIGQNIKKLSDIFKKTKKEEAEKIARLIYRLKILTQLRYHQLIAMDLPKSTYEKGDVLTKDGHLTIKLHSEELYKQYLRDRNLKKFSFLIGQRVDFFMVLYTYDWSSGYYEIIPPKNTRITEVKRYQHPTLVDSKYLMETKKSIGRNDETIDFEDKFNERLVIHIARASKKEIENLWVRPAPTISFRISPHKALQAWICFTICLGLLYNVLLISILIALSLIERASSAFIILENFVGFSIYQALWIFGLIIGNQLWLKEPKFLWKISTWVSFIIVLIGFGVLITNICLLNFK